MQRALIYFMLIACLYSCTKDTAGNNTTTCATCTVLSFRTDIIPVFKTNCALSGCHAGPDSTAQDHVGLDSAIAYATVIEPGVGYVEPGNPNASILYSQLLKGNSNHMPLNGQLDDCDIEKIYCWIQQGALNN